MEIITIPYSFDNYAYLIICKTSGEAAVVDPGEFYPVWQQIQTRGVNLRHVLCTHHHADHIGGLEELLEESPGLKVYAHEEDQKRISSITNTLQHGDTVNVGELSAQVFYTPGHTRGSICYSFEGTLFTGDTLFGGGCGRLFEGSAQQMHQSLAFLNSMASDTKMYFGHEYTVANLNFAHFVEPDNKAVQQRLEEAASLVAQSRPTTPSTLALEFATNPFLRSDQESMIHGLQDKLSGDLTDSLAVFTALRKLKDNF